MHAICRNPLCLLLVLLIANTSLKAQYCTPTVNSSGIYLILIDFQTYNNIQNGVKYSTGNDGYSQTISSSSGILRRYYGGTFFYGIYNPSATLKTYDLAFYCDWNNDGDFTDAGEKSPYPIIGSVAGVTSLTSGSGFVCPLTTPPGDYRMRICVSQDGPGTATPCGSFTGEAEDYMITVPLNKAPQVNASATPFLNPVLNNQFNSNGISVSEFIFSSLAPSPQFFSDADDIGAAYANKAPKGIAITEASTAEGYWQYNIGNGSWLNVGAVNTSNALLLMGDAYFGNYQPHTRLRFVPTAATGTPSIKINAWDGTTGVNGSYFDIAATGGSTAFSATDFTASFVLGPPDGYDKSLYVSSGDSTIYAAPFNTTISAAANPEPLMAGADAYLSGDIQVDDVAQKIYWQSSGNYDKIASANTDGSDKKLSLITGLNYVTGIAIGAGKIYYWSWEGDYSAANIYQADTSGANIVKIYSGTGFYDSKDIEYYDGKLYIQYADADGYKIASLNIDGTGLTNLYTTTAGFGGLSVASGSLFWTETTGIYSMPVTGGSATHLLSIGSNVSLTDLVADPVSSTVYYIHTESNNNTFGFVRKIPFAGGTPENVATVSGLATSLAFDNTLVTLPVSLLSFTGRFNEQAQASLLQWKTSTELNTDHFTLERSTDGRSFTAISNIKSIGNTSTGSSYQYTDNVKGVASQKLYYRLQMVDKNGKSATSNTVLLTKAADAYVVKVWPNPAKGYFGIHLGITPQSAVAYKIYSSNGKLVAKDNFIKKDYILNISAEQSGMYVLQLTFGDGTVKTFKLVNQ